MPKQCGTHIQPNTIPAPAAAVISTDLSHFHDDYTAKQLDSFTSRAVEMLDHEVLSAKLACGYVALRGMLLAAQKHGLGVRTLQLMNSGDISGDQVANLPNHEDIREPADLQNHNCFKQN